MNIPRLRFPEFEDNWNLVSINDLVSIKILDKPMDGNHGNIHPKSSDYVEEGIPFLMANDINDGKIDLENSKKISESLSETLQKGFSIEGDVLLSHKATIGETAIVPRLQTKYIVLTPQVTYYRILDIDKYLNRFLLQVFRTEKFIKSMKTKAGGAGGVRLYIGITEQRNLEIPFIQISEQRKIADFLTAVDKRIELLEKKKTLLETYKKGVIRKIFKQEIRFKDDNGKDFLDWEKFKLKEVLFEHKLRNKESKFDEVFSVSKQKGVVNQIEHLGRSYSAETIDHYKLINNWDIVYTKSPTSDFPFGIIKQNTTGRTGVLSPLYGVFRPKNKWIGKMIASYFESWVNTYNYLIPLVQKGAKNTMNINNDTFLNGKFLELPISESEQEKISNFLFSIEDQLELLETQIDKSKTWKKGLLQKMFV